LEEAAALVAQGRPDFVEDLMAEYAEEMGAALAPLADGVNDQEIDLLEGLGETLTHHRMVLARVHTRVQDRTRSAVQRAMQVCGAASQVGEEADGFVNRTGADLHPVGEALAQRYDVTCDEIMTWFYDGFGFGEIAWAYGISSLIEDQEVDVADLFALREEGWGWGEIMQELGLIVRPPDDAGPPDDSGPPDDAPPPDDAGPPDDAAPPDDAGPPDEAGPPAR